MTLPQPLDQRDRVHICKAPEENGPDHMNQDCPFVAFCHETRQRLQHYADLRGARCWSFQGIVERQLQYIIANPTDTRCTCTHPLPAPDQLDRWRCPWCGRNWKASRGQEAVLWAEA